jgi:hypothetical protein
MTPHERAVIEVRVTRLHLEMADLFFAVFLFVCLVYWRLSNSSAFEVNLVSSVVLFFSYRYRHRVFLKHKEAVANLEFWEYEEIKHLNE